MGVPGVYTDLKVIPSKIKNKNLDVHEKPKGSSRLRFVNFPYTYCAVRSKDT